MNSQTIRDIDGGEIETLDIERDGDAVVLHHTLDLGPNDDAPMLTCMVMSARLYARMVAEIVRQEAPQCI